MQQSAYTLWPKEFCLKVLETPPSFRYTMFTMINGHRIWISFTTRHIEAPSTCDRDSERWHHTDNQCMVKEIGLDLQWTGFQPQHELFSLQLNKSVGLWWTRPGCIMITKEIRSVLEKGNVGNNFRVLIHLCEKPYLNVFHHKISLQSKKDNKWTIFSQFHGSFGGIR